MSRVVFVTARSHGVGLLRFFRICTCRSRVRQLCVFASWACAVREKVTHLGTSPAVGLKGGCSRVLHLRSYEQGPPLQKKDTVGSSRCVFTPTFGTCHFLHFLVFNKRRLGRTCLSSESVGARRTFIDFEEGVSQQRR